MESHEGKFVKDPRVPEELEEWLMFGSVGFDGESGEGSRRGKTVS